MKKIILIIIAMFAFIASSNAQSNNSYTDSIVKEKTKIDWYVATGLSIGNSGASTVSETSYFSLEVGFMSGNWALGLVVGRGNNAFKKNDNIENYCWSIKNAVYFPISNSNIDFYTLFVIGNYISTKTLFIEYGGGISYMPTEKIGLFIQASNWEGYWYVTPGISYSF